MTATRHLPEVFENVAAELSDRAFRVASRHGVQGVSVDLELNLWHALGQESKRSDKCGVKPEGTSSQLLTDSCLATLADKAYQITLKQGFSGSFVDLQLDLWRDLQSLSGGAGN